MDTALGTQHLAATLSFPGCVSFLRTLPVFQTLSLPLSFCFPGGAFLTVVSLLILIHLAVLIF